MTPEEDSTMRWFSNDGSACDAEEAVVGVGAAPGWDIVVPPGAVATKRAYDAAREATRPTPAGGVPPAARAGLARIQDGLWDTDRHAAPADHCRSLARRVSSMPGSVARSEARRAAMGAGALPDIPAAETAVVGVAELAASIHPLAHGWRSDYRPWETDPSRTIDYATMRGRADAAAAMIGEAADLVEFAYLRGMQALYGAAPPDPIVVAAVPAMLPGESHAAAVARLVAALAQAEAVAVRPDRGCDARDMDVRRAVERCLPYVRRLGQGAFSLREYVERYACHAARVEDGDRAALDRAGSSYLNHECGRTGLEIRDLVRHHLPRAFQALRTELAVDPAPPGLP